ncbi:DUF5652 family protein [Patescibacteria group bacterium]
MSPENLELLQTFSLPILLVALWTLPWKGVALWKAAKNSHKIWFVILLIVNTVGLLEIIYIFAFSKKKKEDKAVRETLNI